MSDITATELDAQIRALVAQRAALLPSHPVEPPIDPAQLYRADNMLFHIRPAPDRPGLEMALFHPGLGWVSVVMSRAQIEDFQTEIGFALERLPKRLNPPPSTGDQTA